MRILTIILSLLFIVSFVDAQQIDKITRKCPAPNTSLFGNLLITKVGDVTGAPCPNRKLIFSGDATFNGIHLIDSAYTNGLFSTNPFSIGSSTAINYTGGFGASIFDNTILGTGNGNYYVGEYNNLAVGGTTATNANIFGNLISVSNRANGTLLGSTTTIEGIDIFTNIETPATTAYGVFAYASTGSADAAGTGTISAINGTAGIHLGNTTLVNGGEFRIFNAISGTAATATTANIIRGYVSNITGDTITNLNGLFLGDLTNTGTVVNSTAIKIDTSWNSYATTNNYAIDSLTNSPSRFAGDVFITDNTKGIILKSPDGTCYRYTAANGGALNAGVAVTCP